LTKLKARLHEIWSFHLKIGKYSIFIGLGEVQLRHESGVNMNETELRNLRFRVIQALLEQDPKLAKMVNGLVHWYEIR